MDAIRSLREERKQSSLVMLESLHHVVSCIGYMTLLFCFSQNVCLLIKSEPIWVSHLASSVQVEVNRIDWYQGKKLHFRLLITVIERCCGYHHSAWYQASPNQAYFSWTWEACQRQTRVVSMQLTGVQLLLQEVHLQKVAPKSPQCEIHLQCITTTEPNFWMKWTITERSKICCQHQHICCEDSRFLDHAQRGRRCLGRNRQLT